MLTISDLKEACEVIEREYGSDANVIIQIRDAEGYLINGTYAESMSRDSSGTLHLRGCVGESHLKEERKNDRDTKTDSGNLKRNRSIGGAK